MAAHNGKTVGVDTTEFNGVGADRAGGHGGSRRHPDCPHGEDKPSCCCWSSGDTGRIHDGDNGIWTWIPCRRCTAPVFAPGEKLYFTTNLRTNYYEYTIKLWDVRHQHASRWRNRGWCST